MTRHQRNATAGAVYTYHERQKDTQQSGYGSKQRRLGKDSIKDFDACSLSLQPCTNPVITTQGYIFEKEIILEYILKQKKLIAQGLKKYEKQKNADKEELQELAQAEEEAKIQKFLIKEESISTKTKNPFQKEKPKVQSISNLVGENSKKLPSFWIPELTPKADKNKVKKPETKVLCPMTKKPLKLKDLVPVKFTPIADRDKKTSLISKKDRWMCAVTHDTLGNSVPCAVLRTTGDVVTMECVEKLIRKSDMKHPITGQTLRDKDIIEIARGGTGFSQTNDQLKSKIHGAVLQA